jgi:hypothetical protein
MREPWPVVKNRNQRPGAFGGAELVEQRNKVGGALSGAGVHEQAPVYRIKGAEHRPLFRLAGRFDLPGMPGLHTSHPRQTTHPIAHSRAVCLGYRVLLSRTPQMDWAGRPEGCGNAGRTADSFFHPSRPSGLGHLIHRKSLI